MLKYYMVIKKMWIPRIRILLDKSNEIQNIVYNKWYDVIKFKDKDLKYRISKNGYIDFVLLIYSDKEEALKDSKILYYNILIKGYKDFMHFSMGDMEYITSMFHEEDGITIEKWMDEEEWFYVTKRRIKDHTGLIIFEADSLDDYINTYEVNGELNVTLLAIHEKLPELFKNIKDIDYDVSYNETNQRIFKLFHIVEFVSEEAIKILLLTRVLELMCNKEKKDQETIDLLDKLIDIVNDSNIAYKQDIKSGIGNLKNKSDRQLIKELLNKYGLNSEENIELAMKCYSIRSKIIHGEEYDDKHIYSFGLKHLAISVFEKWNKDKNRI